MIRETENQAADVSDRSGHYVRSAVDACWNRVCRITMTLFVVSVAAVLPPSSSAGGPFHPTGAVEQMVVDSLGDGAGRENTRLMASGLAMLLGPFGAHRLYLGTTHKVAVIYGVTFGGFGALVLLDLGHLLFSKELDPFQNNDRVFMWTKRPVPGS